MVNTTLSLSARLRGWSGEFNKNRSAVQAFFKFVVHIVAVGIFYTEIDSFQYLTYIRKGPCSSPEPASNGPYRNQRTRVEQMLKNLHHSSSEDDSSDSAFVKKSTKKRSYKKRMMTAPPNNTQDIACEVAEEAHSSRALSFVDHSRSG